MVVTSCSYQRHRISSQGDPNGLDDVFAHDRIGLLYTISRTLFDLGVSVRIAKIGTYLDQVVDVFYVTDQQGERIDDEDFMIRIRNRLLEAIKESESDQGIQRWNSRR